VVGIPAGTWTVRLRGDEIHDGRFHAWIERDDPRRVGTLGDREAWQFPSFFEDGTYVDDSTVSSLACGQSVISVANLDEAAGKVNITSSQGPTRDGRSKPDVAAPGTDVLAARGFDPDTSWVRMSGTSMASPYVCGVVGLMLAINPELTSAQINGIIRKTARPLPGHDFAWRNDAGFGRLDPEGCLREAASTRVSHEVKA
jgi:subtilisin family serine protease